jgi:predicted DNA-binding transcriptional regulator
MVSTARRYEMLVQKTEDKIRKLRRELLSLGEFMARSPVSNPARQEIYSSLMKTLERLEKEAAELRRS